MSGLVIDVGADGNMTLPQDLRERLAVQHGGKLSVRTDGEFIVLEALADGYKRAQAIVAQHARHSDMEAADELIAERRAEAQRDS